MTRLRKTTAALALAAAGLLLGAGAARAQFCSSTTFVNKSGGVGNFTTIQAAVNALPAALAGPACVKILDSSNYPEQVTVQNFANAGSSITIMAAGAAAPTVSPFSGATAAFVIKNASVSVQGITISPTGTVTYGVYSSSPNVTISSVSVLDPTGLIGQAGVQMFAENTIAYSTVQVVKAHGVAVGGSYFSILYSSITNATNVAGFLGLWDSGSSAGARIDHVAVSVLGSNGALQMDNTSGASVTNSTFTCAGNANAAIYMDFNNQVNLSSVVAYNGGSQALYIDGNSNNNTVAASSFTTGTLGGVNAAISLSGTHNRMIGVYATGNRGVLNLAGGFDNTVTGSTFAATGGIGLNFNADGRDVVTQSMISNTSGDAVVFQTGASQDTLSYSTATSVPTAFRAVYVNGASTNTITQDYLATGGAGSIGLYLLNASSNTVSFSTVSGSSGQYGVYFQNASTNVLTGDVVSDGSGYAAFLDANSSNNSILGSSITSSSAQYALYLPGASSNTISGSFINGGAFLDSGASANTLIQSTITSLGMPNALLLKTATANVVTSCYVSNPGGTALLVGGNGNFGNAQNAVRQSVIFSSSGLTAAQIQYASTNVFTGDFIMNPVGPALVVVNASSNTVSFSTITGYGNVLQLSGGASSNAISQSYVANTPANGSAGVSVLNGDHNVFNGDTLYSAGAYSLVIGANAGATPWNSVTQSVVTSTGIGLVLQNASFTSISFSTAVGSGEGAWLVGSTWTTIANSYVSGSTAVYVQGSSGTLVGASALQSVGAGGAGLFMTAASAGLTLSSSVVQGGPLGAGVYLDANNAPGTVILSTNAILTGPQYGVYAQSLPAGAPLFVTSNTIVPTVSASTHTYGLYLGGLSAGTSVQNNGIYYRSSGSMGTNTAYAVFAYGSSVQLDHNRINEPGAITGGNYVGVELVGSNAVFKFNDVSATGAGLATPLELQVLNSGGVVVKDNIFLDGLVNPTANFTAALSVDAASQAGFQSDYNAFFTAAGGTAFVGGWGAIPGPHYNLSNWQSTTGRDAHSISGDPLFASLAPGAEDFHVRSSATNGRFNPATQSFGITDSSASPTIDAADPAEPYAREPLPNGVRANQGSYGNTPEASKSSPPPGCSVQYTVASGGGADYTSVGAAVAGISKNLTLANTCIVIVQGGPFFEEVDVNGFINGGNRLTIMGHPNVIPAPVIDPNGTNGAFIVANDSVTISHIDIKPSGSAGYGILATSAAFAATGVNVDGRAFLTAAGVSVTSAAVVSFTSVTVQNAAAIQLYGLGPAVSFSTAYYSGASSSYTALALIGATNGSVSNAAVLSPGATALLLTAGASGNSISASTITSSGGGAALSIVSGSSNTFAQDWVYNSANMGASLQAGAGYNRFYGSSFTAPGTGVANPAFYMSGAHDNSIASGTITGSLWLDPGSARNQVALSTLTSAGDAPVVLYSASSNTVTQSYLYNSAGSAYFANGPLSGEVVSYSTAVGAAGAYALYATAVSSSQFFGDVFAESSGQAALFSGGGQNTIAQSSFTTSSALYPALLFASGSSSNSVAQCYLSNQGGAEGLSINASNGNALSQSFVVSLTTAVKVLASAQTSVEASTASAGLLGVWASGATGLVVDDSYVSGSTAVFVTASTGTVVGGSVLFATGTAGIALELTGGSVGLSLSSSVVYGGALGDGVYLDAFDSGLVVLSTNVFPPSAMTPIYGASLTANSALWITSNTIVPIGSATQNTYGIALNALASGATIQNNAIVMRQGVPAGAGVIAIYAVSSPGLQIDHNRLSDPGVVQGAAFYAAAVGYSPRATFKFNDVNVAASAVSPMTAGYGYYTAGSPNSVLKGNVFFSSMTVSGSSATIWLDTPTLVGTQLDYNDYASSTSRNSVLVGTVSYQYPWSAALGQDAHSISVLPYWASTAPGGENFHPLSQKGRCADPPACTIFVGDSWTAGTLDAADPAEPFALEPLPNGGRANLGSYGGTREASETPSAPGSPAFAAVYASSVAVSFAGLGVGPSSYAVLASTSPSLAGTVFSSASAAAQPLAPQGLAANTTYTFAVQAAWGDLVSTNTVLISTPTLARTPTLPDTGPVFWAIAQTSASVQWAGGNPLRVTTYTVVLTTSPAPPTGSAGDVSITTAPAGTQLEATLASPFTSPLAPNTTYFLYASAINWAGIATPYGSIGLGVTQPAAPSAPANAFVAASTGALVVRWNANGNPLSITTYTVVASTAPDFNAGASSVTLTTAPAGGPSAAVAGLSPSTTYYLQVQTNGTDGIVTSFAFLGSTSTWADVPALGAPPTFASVLATQIGLHWGAGANPAGTLYDVVTATSAGFTGAATSSFTYALSFSTTGLAVNATYFFEVAAVNAQGLSSPFLALGSTWTLANAPATAASTFTSVGSSSFTVNWSANGNPLATTYVVQLSTAPDFNAFASSVSFSTAAPAGPSATFTGLANFTTYYFRVSAANGLGVPTPFVALGSTTTLPPSLLPPALAGAPAIFTTSMTATWGLVSGATGYTLVASTLSANPPTLVWASSSPFGAAATTATLAGLQPDTTYFLFVRSLGPNAASFFAAYAATSTLPALPQAAPPTFGGVAYTSFTAAWGGGGNPLGVATYTVVASTAPDFNLWASSVSFSTSPAAGPQAAFAGVSPNTTYYVEVMAVGNGGTATPFVALGSTTTRVADPLSLGAAGTFVAASSSSLSVAWGASGNPLALTVYALVASTAPDFNAGASSATLSTAPAAGPSAALSGLLVNATYYVGVRALGVGTSSSNFVVLGATATRADLPAPAAFAGISTGSIVAGWTAPANPAGTLYLLQTALDPLFATTVTSSSTYGVSVATTGLTPNTTYFFRVQASNVDGAATPFVLLGSTATLASPPLSAASTFGAVGISSLTVSWLANGNPLSITTYTVQASTDPAFGVGASSVTLTTAPAAGPSATLGGLMFGTTYYVRVSAVNFDGIATAWTSLGSTTTLLSNLVPLIVDSQTGDAQWRSANVGLYRVSFQDGSGTHLNKFAVATSTTPGQPGAFVDAVANLSPADAFSTPWSLPASVFGAMLEGTTNYVTVRVYNNVPDTNTVVDAFYVLKDTTPPSVSGPVPGDAVVRSTSGTFYAISSTDTGSGLAAFQYSASLTPGAGDAALVPWTNIPVSSGAKAYAAPWTVNFAALASGVTNYVSVRAWDLAGNTTTVKDAFYVLKDTAGPAVSISSPVAATGFVSSTATIAGSAASPFGVQGTEVAVFQPSANLYWNPGAGAFNSGAPVWMAAVGISSWTLSAPVAFADGVAYKVVARSSTTFGQYSTLYATASFVADFAAPTVGVQAPVPNSTVSSLPVLSGTAADPGTAASGVSAVEVRLRRNSDGLWWNWFAQGWSSLAVSTVAVGTTTWSLSPTAQLQANLASGASYYVAARASDNALPSNQGNFFAQGATFTYSNPTPPAAVADLAAVSGPAPGQVALSWHATGENGSAGIVLLGQYAVFYSTFAGAAASTAAAQVAFSTANVQPGAASGFNVTGLTAGGTYFLRIALQNTDGNWSAFSNQASTVATPAPLNAILGHVVNASTQGVTAVEVDAWNSAGALVTTAFTLADGSGTYSVGGLTAGSYKLKATWTVNGIASSVWQDGIPMGSVGVDFSLNINYSLATLTGSLATLTTASSRTGVSPSALARPSLGGSYVELAQSGRTVARVGVEPSGRWTIPSLLPGSYAVRAYTGVSFTDYQSVTLAEGETKSIGFVFDPLPDAQVYAFPNPAKDATTFRFLTPFNPPVDAVVDVFDLAGRLVKEIPGSSMSPAPSSGAGVYHAPWDLTNSRGQAVASGVYLYLVKVKNGDTIVKVVKKLAVVR